MNKKTTTRKGFLSKLTGAFCFVFCLGWLEAIMRRLDRSVSAGASADADAGTGTGSGVLATITGGSPAGVNSTTGGSHAISQSSSNLWRGRGGFVLVLSLVVMSLMIALIFMLTAFLYLELSMTTTIADREQARLNAICAAKLAVAQLQTYAGADRVATVPSINEDVGLASGFFSDTGLPVKSDGWTVAVRTRGKAPTQTSTTSSTLKRTRTPLISGAEFLSNANTLRTFGFTQFREERKNDSSNYTTTLLTGKKVPEVYPAVNVPWIGNDGAASTARFAFWIEDESQKADISTHARRWFNPDSPPSEETLKTLRPKIQTNAQLASQFHATITALNINCEDPQLWREQMESALNFGGLENAWLLNERRNTPFPFTHEVHNHRSFGLLTNADTGGLRINWSSPAIYDSENSDYIANKTANPSVQNLPCDADVFKKFFHRKTVVGDSFLSPKETAAYTDFINNPQNGLPITIPPMPLTGTDGITDAEFKRRLQNIRFPIVAGVRLRLGVFHGHTDALTRLRFHVEILFWNPWSNTLYLSGENDKDKRNSYIALFDAPKMPKIRVRNMNTGAVIESDLSNLPVYIKGSDNVNVSQTACDTTINANLVFPETDPLPASAFPSDSLTATAGKSLFGFLAGEVYHMLMPNPVGKTATDSKPEGLARFISNIKWFIQSDAKKPNTPPPAANGGSNWLHATHEIEISGEMPPEGVSFIFREPKSKLIETNQTAADYSPAAILIMKNIQQFANFSYVVLGSEFDEALSNQYRIEKSDWMFYLRLRDVNTPAARAKLLTALEKIDPRHPVLDFNDPDVEAIYEVEPDVLVRVPQPELLPDGTGRKTESPFNGCFLSDEKANSHTAPWLSEKDVAYTEMIAFDRPAFAAPVSVASLRHLPQFDTRNSTALCFLPSGALNQNYPLPGAGNDPPAQSTAAKTDPVLICDAQWFDKAFFAEPFDLDVFSKDATRKDYADKYGPWSTNSWLSETFPDSEKEAFNGKIKRDDLRKDDAGARYFIRGAFNVNCENEDAWKIILSRTLDEWQRRTDGSASTSFSSSKEPLKNVFFRFSFNADAVRKFGVLIDFADEFLRTVSTGKTADGKSLPAFIQAHGAQGFRALEKKNRDALARDIATLISKRRKQEVVDTTASTFDKEENARRHFLTLKDFATRLVRTHDDDAARPLLAQAIARNKLNSTAVFAGSAEPHPFSPLRINQGDFLETLLPALTVRGDTFRVRVRGSVFTPVDNNSERARADAEIIVQRFPEYLDSPETQLSTFPCVDKSGQRKELSKINKYFGRRFKVVSFRWLTHDEAQK